MAQQKSSQEPSEKVGLERRQRLDGLRAFGIIIGVAVHALAHWIASHELGIKRP